ncbi:hypothetical protein CAF53_02220 [Sphingobium sp. LB126]|nr:hypothetical protein CAF53_02220 [Sphingobium sp. LB126]
MADEMNQEFASNNHEKDTAKPVRVRPRARDYFWRPWYARLWWSAIAFYWGAMAGVPHVKFLAEFYQSSAGLVVVILNPFTAAALLGVGYARSMFASGEWVLIDAEEHQTPRSRSVTGLADPFTDPYDPSAGTLYRQHHGRTNR